MPCFATLSHNMSSMAHADWRWTLSEENNRNKRRKNEKGIPVAAYAQPLFSAAHRQTRAGVTLAQTHTHTHYTVWEGGGGGVGGVRKKEKKMGGL